MSNKIQKLNKLVNPESFIQVNTIKGYSYVDKAGQLVNSFYKDDAPPSFVMDLQGLIFNNPIEKVSEIRITPTMMWARFTEIDSHEQISSVFVENMNLTLGILNVEKINRIGWRNYFVYEFPSETESNKFLSEITKNNLGQLNLINIAVNTKKSFNANISIQPVIKNKDQNKKAVLFDIDIFEDKKFSLKEVKGKLDEFYRFLKDENGFLEIVNNAIK